VPAGVGNITAIVGGADFSLALRSDFRITTIQPSAQGPKLKFQTFAGRQYSVEYSTNLSASNWAFVPGSGVNGSGQEASVTDTNSLLPSKRFYRARQVTP
jgi:hypothetical protein